MYSSSAMRRMRPLRSGIDARRRVVGRRAVAPEGSEPTGLTVDVMPYSSA